MDDVEERVAELERVLGVSKDTKASNFNVEPIYRALEKHNCSRILKVDIATLRKLQSVMETQTSEPLEQKLQTIVFCEEMIRKRAQMLENWDSKIQTVLDSESLRSMPQYAATVEPLANEIQEVYAQYEKEFFELLQFRENFLTLMTSLKQKVESLEARIKSSEQQ